MYGSPRPLHQDERTRLMMSLSQVVRRTGESVLTLKPENIHDTVEVDRHQFSTVDANAGIILRKAIEDIMGPVSGTVLEESEISRRTLDVEKVAFPLLIFDAVEGSTNTKRGLAAHLRRPILGGTSAMVLENPELSSVAASAFFDFSSRQVFATVRTEPGSFLSFVNDRILPWDMARGRGDSQVYAAVPGYSHGNVEERARVERVLLSAGIRTTGGSRSSAQDLVDMLGNQIDAYVDLRALFSGSTESRDEVLHSWDVGGLLPVLDGLGFMITDVRGRCWQKSRFDEHLALIVARPELGGKILDAVRQLPFVSPLEDERVPVSLPLPPARLGS